MEAAMSIAESSIDAMVTYGGPVFITIAALLIGCVVAVYFLAIIPEVAATKGLPRAAVHVAFGLTLLGNIAFNYVSCIRTHPGCTADLPPEVLVEAAEGGRYCHRCQLPKPTTAHHCHICDKCILQEDHHCPWMDACIGWANYRFFLLTLLWLSAGAMYATRMAWWRLSGSIHDLETPLHLDLLLLFVAVLTAAMGAAVGILLAWHFYLVATVQSTIDFQRNWAASAAAKRLGQMWSRPPHPSAREHFQAIFDARGRLWWLTWLLPNWAPKRGDGVHLGSMRQR